MLINYLKTGWRNLKKYPVFSLITLLGLFLGIVFTFLIAAFIHSELQVNAQLKNADRQYFLKSVWKDPNMGLDITTVGPLARRLKEDYPHLVSNFHRWDGITSVVSKGDKYFREGLHVGDSTLLTMFGFPMLYGDPATALNDPFTLVITKEKAIKYFGRANVLGQTLTIQSFSGTTHEFKITGVMENPKRNSVTWINEQNHTHFFLGNKSLSYFGRAEIDSWLNTVIPSYIELQKGVNPKDLENPIRELLGKHTIPDIYQNLRVEPVQLKAFYRESNNRIVSRMIYTLSIVAFFILLMGIVNFVNLSISRAGSRLKEIGIRKVMGGLKKQLIGQFLVESTILVSIAALLATMAYPLFKPLFNEIVGKELPDMFDFPPVTFAVVLVLIVVLGLLSGFYPALVLSSMKSTDTLKGRLKTVGEKKWLRKSLVGLQFSIALIVLVSMIVVARQVDYFFSNGLGYNKEYVIAAQVPRDWSVAGVQKMETIREEFSRLPEITTASLSYEIPNGMNGGQPLVYRFGTDSTQSIPMQAMVSDGYFASAFQIPLKAGSFFETPDTGDSSKIIVNEKAVLTLGWKSPEEAVGQQVRISGSNILHRIQGVVADYHFGSMQESIAPVIFFPLKLAVSYRYLSFKIKPGNVNQTIRTIEKKWSELLPGSAFEYRFMDDYLKELYTSEIQLKKASSTAATLALAIMLLGVVGLVTFSIHKRTKEIGIRKVLGATVLSIQQLFIRDFLPVMGIAAVISCPIAYLIMRDWLNDYAYRIELSPLFFFGAIAILALITVVLILVQTLRAATANPSNNLKIE